MAFTTIQPDDQVVSSEIVVSPAWSSNTFTLTNFYTSSAQESGSTGKFYLNVYQTASSSVDAITQFSIAFGNINGSGSRYFNQAVTSSAPTKDIYGQWRALILGDENSKFTFDYTSGSDSIAVISVARSRYKQSFNPGSLTLTLSDGVSTYISLTDNSQIQTSATFINSTQYYTLVSGSQGSVYSNSGTVSGSYGYVFPDLGTIILNPNALALPTSSGGINASWTLTSNTVEPSPFYNHNNRVLFKALTTGSSRTFSLQASEVLSSNYIFCRAKNAQNNYTSNPTIIDTDGNLIFNQLIYSPVTYITTVGLYNDSNELLAVAKLSKPLQKDFTKESLIRVKLDY